MLKYFSMLSLSVLLTACVVTNNYNNPQTTKSSLENEMQIAKGEFSVKMTPVEGSHTLKLDKIYTGDLLAEGFGEMLATRSQVAGSASYVAIETVSGELNGKSGAFTLVHRGVMQGENKELLVTISPDSGTEELMGISGSLEIINADGKHSYILNYSF